MTDSKLAPPVMWAQRSPVVFLTINLEDVKDPVIKFDKQSVYFHGTGGHEQHEYEVTIPLYKEIDPEKSRSFNRERCIEIVLAKVPFFEYRGASGKIIKVEIWQDHIEIYETTNFQNFRKTLQANQEESYWPFLTSDKKKHHWLKCDFNKWHDEDDSGDEGLGGMGGGGDFEEMMRQMGGLGGSDKKPSFDDLDVDEGGDSDDEPIPDLE